MILQYFKKKENKYKDIADKIYLSILSKSKELIRSDLFKEKNFNTSFEIISIILIFNLKILKNFNEINYKNINDLLMQNFINDLDKSLRDQGISDMSIGKYVKKYVKKFYFRIKLLDPILIDFHSKDFANYIHSFEIIEKKNTDKIIVNFREIFKQIEKNKHNIY